MGRTSKFTFPVPGRKKNVAPPPPMPPGPMSKAQKILGTSDLNTGPRGVKGGKGTKGWDATSVSGISVSVSETTSGYTDPAFGLLDDTDDEDCDDDEFDTFGRMDKAPPPPVDEGRNLEDESEAIPRGWAPEGDPNENNAQHYTNSQANSNPQVADNTDASSIRKKRMSASTITSFYDKSKMPLSISQQTSSSAMAKGIPPKAQQSADQIEESAAVTPRRRRVKPGLLDLTSLLPSRSRSSSSKNVVLGNDMMTKSPSVISVTTEAPPVPVRRRAERKLSQKPTSESLKASAQVGDMPPLPPPPPQPPQARGAKKIRGLHNLYDHYEQMMFKTIVDDEDEMEDEDGENSGGSKDTSVMPPEISEPPRRVGSHSPQTLPAEGQLGGLAVPPKSPSGSAVDCSGSVSSRYTRTSKGSKRTNNSLMDSDLNEKSVLALSDDSDDELIFTSEPAPALETPTRVDSVRHGSPSGSRRSLPSRPHSHNPRRISSSMQSTRSARATSHHFLTPPPTTPPTASLPEIPKNFTSRRASAMSTASAKPARSSSRASVKTSSSRGSRNRAQRSKTVHGGTPGLRRSSTTPTPPGAGLQKHRLSTGLHMAANARSSILPHHLPQLLMASQQKPSDATPIGRPRQRATSSEQPTPPLSPSSVEFCVRSGSVDSGGGENPRFMAVTKQEEMLLSAMRTKRRDMRGGSVGTTGTDSEGPRGHRRHVSTSTSTGSAVLDDFPVSPAGRRRMSLGGFSTTSSNGAMEAPTGQRRRRRSSLAGPPSQLTVATTAADSEMFGPATPGLGNQVYKQEYFFSTHHPTSSKEGQTPLGNPARYTSYKGYTIPHPQHLSFVTSVRSPGGNLEAERHERVLMFLDRPLEEAGEDDLEMYEEEEPSADLSEFMQYDGVTPTPSTPFSIGPRLPSLDLGPDVRDGNGKRDSEASSQLSPKAFLETNSIAMSPSLGGKIEEAQREPQMDMRIQVPPNSAATVDGQGFGEMSELEVPRPDSPISPAGLGFLPPAHDIRLSAVGAGTSWLSEEEMVSAY